ncbi:MAG TPA: ABC transporter ATP-binding protein [Gemmata sp.]|nr:ABC transporter ATP-binding protein [Gemmata sp.]
MTRTFGTFTALSDITLSLPVGRIGLLGPNGAGKSTLLKILMGLIPPTSGTGRVLNEELGRDGDSTSNRRLRGLIGFMPEVDALIPGLTGVEYVSLAGELYGMPRREAQRRAHEVLSYLELEEARYRRVEEYSTGMKQRAKLAQALVHDPPVLLLDEPTSGLDPSGRDAMLRLIKALGSEHGKSVILSTHLLADVEAVCERVVIMAGGRVRGQGTVAELCTRRRDRYRLRVQGEPTGFRTDLHRKGVTLLVDDGEGEWRVLVPTGWKNLMFFELARDNAVVIRSLVPDDETLEELFLRTVSDVAGAV